MLINQTSPCQLLFKILAGKKLFMIYYNTSYLELIQGDVLIFSDCMQKCNLKIWTASHSLAKLYFLFIFNLFEKLPTEAHFVCAWCKQFFFRSSVSTHWMKVVFSAACVISRLMSKSTRKLFTFLFPVHVSATYDRQKTSQLLKS